MFHDAQFMPILPPRAGGLGETPSVEAPVTGQAPAIQTIDARRKFLELIEARRASASVLFAQSCTIPWRVPLFQRPQHVARAMAKSGAISLYFTFADDWAEDYLELEDNVFLIRDNDLLHEISNAAVSFYSTSPAHSPELYRRVLADGNRLIYEYIDHIDAEISGEGNLERLRTLFETAVENADLLAVSARSLMRELIDVAGSERVFYLPNAVDMEHYDRARADAGKTVPQPLAKLVASGRPMVGYFGAIAPWLWYEALEELARSAHDFEFVFLGPDYFSGSKGLPDRSNVHWLGTVDYHDLPLWAQHFDVAMIPFSPGEIARTTSPLKLFEYFALGKPVVVTSEMDECTAFEEVFSGDSPAALLSAIKGALEAGRDEAYVESIQSHARHNSWLERAKTMIGAIEGLRTS
jgi:glycosyltransferase involved in cell wall biosynthesis